MNGVILMEFKSRLSSKFSLPDSDGLDLCRVLGLAISNVSMYGMEHSVTASSVAAAYDELVAKVDSYGEIDFVLEGAGIIINGCMVDVERTTGQLFVTQLNKIGVHDFAFTAPLNRLDFNRFISIIAASPGIGFLVDGFEAAVGKADLECVRVRNVSYARVDKDADLAKMNFGDAGCGCGDDGRGGGVGEAGAGASACGIKSYDLGGAGGGAKVFDLDMELGAGDVGVVGDVGGGGGASGVVDSAVLVDARSYIEKMRSVECVQRRLMNMVRSAGSAEARQNLKDQLFGAGFTDGDWLELLSGCRLTSAEYAADSAAGDMICRMKRKVEEWGAEEFSDANGKCSCAVSDVLDSIALDASRIASRVEGDISTLAGKVDADRETIAMVEHDARTSGIGLNLSRDELLDSLAEINQELMQALTVVSSVTDVLVSEKMGAMTGAQHDVLRVAAEGVGRIQKLISYLNILSGFPETLSPDRNLLDEAYGV